MEENKKINDLLLSYYNLSLEFEKILKFYESEKLLEFILNYSKSFDFFSKFHLLFKLGLFFHFIPN
jgi:hypothetical protein